MKLKTKVILKIAAGLALGSIGFTLAIHGEGGFAFTLIAGWLMYSANRDMDDDTKELDREIEELIG